MYRGNKLKEREFEEMTPEHKPLSAAPMATYVPPTSSEGYKRHHNVFTGLQALVALLSIGLFSLTLIVTVKFAKFVHPLWLAVWITLFVLGSTVVVISLVFGLCSKRLICKKEPQLQSLPLDFHAIMVYRIGLRVGIVLITLGSLNAFYWNFILHGAQKDCHPVALSIAGIIPDTCSRGDMLANICGFAKATWTANKREGPMEECYWMITADLMKYLDVLSILAAIAVLLATSSEMIASCVASVILSKVAPAPNPLPLAASQPSRVVAKVDMHKSLTTSALRVSPRVSITSETKPRSSRVLATRPTICATSDSRPSTVPDTSPKPLSKELSRSRSRSEAVVPDLSPQETKRRKSKKRKSGSEGKKRTSRSLPRTTIDGELEHEDASKKVKLHRSADTVPTAEEEPKKGTPARKKRSRKSSAATEHDILSPGAASRGKSSGKHRTALVDKDPPEPMVMTKKKKRRSSVKGVEPRADKGSAEVASAEKKKSRTKSPTAKAERTKEPAEAVSVAKRKKSSAKSSADVSDKLSPAEASGRDAPATARVHREDPAAAEPGMKNNKENSRRTPTFYYV